MDKKALERDCFSNWTLWGELSEATVVMFQCSYQSPFDLTFFSPFSLAQF